MPVLPVVSVLLAMVAGGNVVPVVEAVEPIDWHSCRLGPDDDTGRELEAAGATCATVRVPLDHARPDGRTIDLAVSRIAADPARRRGVLLANPGGPGAPGLGYPAELRPLLGDIARQYDLIGFDPRFTGRSNPISCGPVRLADVFRGPGVDRAGFDRSARLAARFAAGCHARNPGLLEHAGIRDVARDVDAIRRALGAPTVSYYGVSWGADLGVVYSQLYGDRVDRMVVDSVTDVEGSEYHHLATGERTEAALDEWAAWAAWRHPQYGLGRTGVQVRATVERLQARAARTPIRLGGYRIDANAWPFVLQQSGLGDQDGYPRLARTVRLLADAAAGRPVTAPDDLAGFLGQYYGSDPAFDRFTAASFAMTCNDGGWPRGPRTYWRTLQRVRPAQPLFGPNVTPCAFWPGVTSEPPLAVGHEVPLLIVQAERDNIPLEWARRLRTKLTGASLVTVDRRAHGVYDERVPCIVRTVNAYLAGGALPPDASPCEP